MEKIRVLHCLETIGSGGVERLRHSLSMHLDKDRFEQRIVCTHAIGGLPAKMVAEGMPVIPIGTFKSPLHISGYKKVLEVIRNYRPHIIHGAVFEGVTMGAVAGKIGRVPVIISEETSDNVGKSWKAHLLMWGLVFLSDSAVAESPAAGNYLRDVLKISKDKVRVICNGVEVVPIPPAEASAALRKSLGIGPDDFVVGSVGRLLDSHKRFSDLIRAVALLKEKAIPLKLLIVGDGPDMDFLKGLAQEQEVAERVVFAGYQVETAPFYGCMDLFGLASSMEAFGLVLAEAMLARLPVVATEVGGIPYVAADKVTGFLVKPFSPEQFADAIETFFQRPDLRKQMGNAGYERSMAHFSAKAYVRSIEDLYLELCRKKGII